MTVLQRKEWQSWLDKAESDFKTSLKLASGDDPIFETAIYHCQQAAEKALKGCLVFRGIRAPKTHDIGMLLSMLGAQSLIISETEAEELTTYGTVYRYPGEIEAPSLEEFEQSRALVEKILIWANSTVNPIKIL